MLGPLNAGSSVLVNDPEPLPFEDTDGTHGKTGRGNFDFLHLPLLSFCCEFSCPGSTTCCEYNVLLQKACTSSSQMAHPAHCGCQYRDSLTIASNQIIIFRHIHRVNFHPGIHHGNSSRLVAKVAAQGGIENNCHGPPHAGSHRAREPCRCDGSPREYSSESDLPRHTTCEWIHRVGSDGSCTKSRAPLPAPAAS